MTLATLTKNNNVLEYNAVHDSETGLLDETRVHVDCYRVLPEGNRCFLARKTYRKEVARGYYLAAKSDGYK